MNRRVFLGVAAAGVAGARQQTSSVSDAIGKLKPMTEGVQPITDDERRGRIEKARRLMAARKIGAIFMERGSTMFYYTGTRNMAGLLIPAKGEIAWIVPAADAQRANDIAGGKTAGATKFVLTYSDSGGQADAIKQALKDCGVTAGNIGLEEQVRFSIFESLHKETTA